MPFVLRKIDGHGGAVYVAPHGSPQSYVTRDRARRFATREAAQADACGNESAVWVSPSEDAP